MGYLSRVDRGFDPTLSGVAMTDHVPDDESCWCGVPLECHDDLYDAICGRHHQPDPIPGPEDEPCHDRSVLETMITGGRDHDPGGLRHP